MIVASFTREAQELLRRAAGSKDGDLRFLALAGLRQLRKPPRLELRPKRTPRVRKGRAS